MDKRNQKTRSEVIQEQTDDLQKGLLYTFPKQEFEARFKRARELMSVHRLDAIFVTEKENVGYFSGWKEPQFITAALDKIRVYAIILPLEGDPTFFSPGGGGEPTPMGSWVSNRVAYTAPGKDMFANIVPKLVDTFREMKLVGKKIGCELGREQRIWMQVDHFLEVRRKMSNTKFVDASQVLNTLRAFKSQLEIDCVRKAGSLTSRACERTFTSLKPGMTELEVEKLLRINLYQEGAERIRVIFVSSAPPYDRHAIGRRLEKGDQVHFDIMAVYNDYICDITRDGWLGSASQEAKKLWRVMTNLRMSCIDLLEPGVTLAQVARTCLKEIGKIKHEDPVLGRQFDRLQNTISRIGRIGHGIGREIEYPSISLWEKLTMEPGLALAINPNLHSRYGQFNHEDNFVVTASGHELLSSPAIKHEVPIY